MMLNRKGLTLIEMLVAFAISAIIVMGTYTLFKATTDIRIRFKDKSEDTSIQTSITLLFNRDMNAALDIEPTLSDYATSDSISFVTHNSFYFNGAIPVTVTYALDDGYLIREELNEKMNYKQVIRLIGDVSKFDIYYFDGDKYIKDVTEYKIVKIEVEVKKHNFYLIAGKFSI